MSAKTVVLCVSLYGSSDLGLSMSRKIVNMVASTRLTDTIDLYDVANTLDLDFEAEQFPGMVYRVGEDTHGEGAPKVCLLLFGSGRLVATGAKSYDDVVIAMNHIFDDLKNHEFELWDFDEDNIQVQNSDIPNRMPCHSQRMLSTEHSARQTHFVRRDSMSAA